jgi:dihydrofolate reductase
MKKPKVIIIAAVGPAPNNKRIIGDGNRLPWHLPRDLRFFRRVTINHTVMMGRKTYESFGKRPLPKRDNIVITRNMNYIANGCTVYHSLEEALSAVKDKDKVFIIGGGDIYRQAMKFADEILLTEIIDKNKNLNLFPLFKGTVYFPEIDENEWKLTRPGKLLYLASNKFPVEKKQKLSQRALYFRVIGYKRTNADL